MTSPTTLFPFISLVPLLVLRFLVTGELINHTCKNSSKNDPNINYNFCVNAIQAFPASQCADLTHLGLISLTLIKNNITDTRCTVKRFLRDKKPIDGATKAALKDCLELYSDSTSTLSDAWRDFKENRFFDANIKVSSVLDSATTCELGFEDLRVSSPLKNENGYIFQLSAIALSIINMFHSIEHFENMRGNN